MKQYPLSLHIFRRDLRLVDNTALIEAQKQSECIIPCFIFDKRQIEHNEYKSEHGMQFMIHSLQDLHAKLMKKNGKLYLFYGIAEEIIAQLLTQLNISALFVNRDYTPFSCERDRRIEQLCSNHGIHFCSYSDALLHEPGSISCNNKPYTIFTPYWRKASLLPVLPPRKEYPAQYYQKPISIEQPDLFDQLLKTQNPTLRVQGGRSEGLSLLKKIVHLKHYETMRNTPALNGTTHLSAHNKFGTISVREFFEEVVHHFGREHTLIKELHWRDFFTHIAFHYPHVYGKPFHLKYENIPWNQNMEWFHAWCEGRTGFPIVDAGMRELNTTGYMHNRVRMITASFLTKDLHVDWRWGEKYFAQQLIDYDPAVNNGNWQWAASTGCDAQPYFRIFNPWLQQKKFDPDCLYIKRWIPELASVPVELIHGIEKLKSKLNMDYPLPIVDHAVEAKKSKAIYSEH